ncbi:MAG TPA: hypothetical protein VEU07_15785, partial [Candidatus Acidoferrum sp.]|nr:hypothetical protein [Candidatus Acidoferrum sp.]
MAPEVLDLRVRQRRWNAAALQRYLKRRAEMGFSMYLRDLQAAARDIEAELCGSTNSLDLVRQAWEHLILTGLVVVDSRPDDEYAWRLADAP